jgi:hypothetical protein
VLGQFLLVLVIELTHKAFLHEKHIATRLALLQDNLPLLILLAHQYIGQGMGCLTAQRAIHFRNLMGYFQARKHGYIPFLILNTAANIRKKNKPTIFSGFFSRNDFADIPNAILINYKHISLFLL